MTMWDLLQSFMNVFRTLIRLLAKFRNKTSDETEEIDEMDGILTANRAPPPKNRRTPSKETLRQYKHHTFPQDLYSPHRTKRKQKKHLDNEVDESYGVFSHTLELEDDRHLHDRAINGYSPGSSSSRKPVVPPLDLGSLHEHVDGDEAIHAWVQHNEVKEQYEGVLSPRSSNMKKKNSAPPDTDIPPSPPTSQPFIQGVFRSDRRPGEETDPTAKQLTKQIHTLKKKLRQFEANFETVNGYKPSHSDKAARPEIKKMMLELSKAKKQLRDLKEKGSGSGNRLNESLPTVSNTRDPIEHNHFDSKPTMEETLHTGLNRLEEKRKDGNRPENIYLMTREQIADEKLAVQKVLLTFENIHGRPSTKGEKDLMRPLYDRYRNIKRLIAKMPPKPMQDGRRDGRCESPHQSDLQPIFEHETMEFQPKHQMAPHAYPQEEDDDAYGVAISTDFAVTRDFELLRETMRPSGVGSYGDDDDDDEEFDSPARTGKTLRSSYVEDATLHEASIAELIEKQLNAKSDKKRLRKILRDFEDSFFKRTGRKVQREDRDPMETEYIEYKQIKARLRLLEALITKHDGSKTI
ncbi:protein FAM13A-like [Saccoglossus kowalevskii]